MAHVHFTDAEADLALLALEYFRRYHLDECDDEEVRAEQTALIRSAKRKLQDAP